MATPLLDNAQSGFNPGESWQANYIFRGLPGTGKTTAACGIHDSIHGDCDASGAGRFVVNGRSQRCAINDAETFQQFIAKLLEEARIKGPDRRFKVVILDPAGRILGFCRDIMCKKLGVAEIEGFDHGKVANLFRKYLLDLTAAGYYWVLIDHELNTRMLKPGGVEIIMTEPLLPQSINKFIEQDCHHILTFQLAPNPVSEVQADGKKRVVTRMTHRITTKPGRKTSLANPKARVWLPEVLDGIPETGDASEVWDYFDGQYKAAIDLMTKQVQKASKN